MKLSVFVGALIPMDAAWAAADITIGWMTLINLPAYAFLGKITFDFLKDFETQKKAIKPVFKSKSIGLDEDDFEFWK